MSPPRPPMTSGSPAIRAIILAWIVGGIAAGCLGGLFEWGWEPERMAAGATPASHIAWRALGAAIIAVIGGLSTYAVARPIQPSEMVFVVVVPLVFTLNPIPPARFASRLVFLIVPLGLIYGLLLRGFRNRGEAGRADG